MTTEPVTESPPAEVLAAWNLGPGTAVTPLAGGLINRTWLVEGAGGRAVLQRVNAIFKPEVHLDIDAITRHLESRGMVTPRLVPTVTDTLWATDHAGGTWRVLTHVEGRTIHKVPDARVAAAAGALVGRFHRAVADLQHRFHFTRPGAHDTPAHLARLAQALEEKADHPLYARVAPLGQAILEDARALPALPTGPLRIAHGDLKVSNILFTQDLSRGVALVDLDTMAHMVMPVEMGDAMRSWTNPAGEDATEVHVDTAIFQGAMTGYAAEVRGMLTPPEVEHLVTGTQVIALELASRFCADALNESYFGWDPARYASRGEHNLVRARGQHLLARSVAASRAALEAAVRAAFAGG